MKRDETRRDETRRDETRRDETRRDETRRDETRRDETRRDEPRRDATRRDATRRDAIPTILMVQRTTKDVKRRGKDNGKCMVEFPLCSRIILDREEMRHTHSKPDNTITRTWERTKDEVEPHKITSQVYVCNR